MLYIDNISVRFQSFALEGISLEIQQGDYLALLGVSGAGKTILLEILAGLQKPDSGRILLEGRDITNEKIQKRGIGLVYQDLSLFPHLRVIDNIAYPLRRKGIHIREIRETASGLASRMGVGHLLTRFPETLSGGEAQRVALARTLASEPEILLLDEPLSKLDVKLKSELRALLAQIHKSGKTIIHVTHDFMEAATLANRVAVIENGRLVQHGTPDEVLRHPQNEFVARFSGIKNIFPCSVSRSADDPGLCIAKVSEGPSIFFLGERENLKGYVMVPQEDIIVSEHSVETSAVNRLNGVIKEAYLSGYGMEIVVDAGVEFVVSVSKSSREKLRLEPGKKVWLGFKASAVRFIDN